jgi:hypothetical protein
VYGVCVGPSEKFERIALPGIKAVDPNAPILVRYNQQSIFQAYNSMIDEATSLDIDGIVFIHDDVLIRDENFSSKVISLFDNPEIGIVGAIGASSLKSVEWWWYETRGRAYELGRTIDYGVGTCDVDAVDGLLIAMSPTAMRTLRFDDVNFSGFHGYDVDIGMQVKSAGLRVVVTDLDILHVTVPGQVTNRPAHLRAGLVWRRKWRWTISQRIGYIVFLWSHLWRKSDLGLRQWIVRVVGPVGPRLETFIVKMGKRRHRDL